MCFFSKKRTQHFLRIWFKKSYMCPIYFFLKDQNPALIRNINNPLIAYDISEKSLGSSREPKILSFGSIMPQLFPKIDPYNMINQSVTN